MNYNLLPSLEHLATVSVAALLYNDYEIEKMLEGEKKSPIHSNCKRNETWNLIEMKIMDSLSSLLPSSLQVKVAEVIHPMRDEVFRWKVDHSFLLKHIGEYSYIYNSCLSWKTDGTINREQTTKNLLMNENIDPKIRFITACIYFLEDEVLALWERIKENHKKSIIRIGTNSAVRFWMKQLKKGNIKHWREMIEGYFGVPCIRQSDIPLRLSSFYDFLSSESKQKYIKFFGAHQVHTHDLRLCLKNKHENECREIFRSRPDAALFICLRWPFRSLYIKMAEEIISYLTAKNLSTLLLVMIVSYIQDGYEDFQLFEEIWKMSPAALKNDVMKDIRFFLWTKRLLEEANHSQPLEKIVRKCYLDEALQLME
ncbi:hypothetical protein AVEN_28465-1 [Araneus ventricosus]|uniref:Uncharacterized protein n=1 Tax=Araneus ventricosus TaxID=182803 RepID=A0A4Y2I157_ARAVE|nr:hypothetical protein AVEN_28465-1 [Araneus ventricosus]